jgi:quercetin dioxygenase-like cupin family protein
MARAGQVIQGQGGFQLRLVKTGAETGGELLEMEATYAGTGALPPEHFHPKQEEQFEVLEGTVRAILDGEERLYHAGDAFAVPAGVRHQMTADSPARLRWEVRPALRTAEFFERLNGDGPDSARAAASFADFMAEFSDEVRLTQA